MSLFGILKGAVGLGPGIEGCKREAAAGKAEAQFALGGFYERGQFGLPQDYTESGKWYDCKDIMPTLRRAYRLSKRRSRANG